MGLLHLLGFRKKPTVEEKPSESKETAQRKPLSSLDIYKILGLEDPDHFAAKACLDMCNLKGLDTKDIVGSLISKRRSGQTTRIILDALSYHTTSGNPIIFVAKYQHTVDYMLQMARNYGNKLTEFGYPIDLNQFQTRTKLQLSSILHRGLEIYASQTLVYDHTVHETNGFQENVSTLLNNLDNDREDRSLLNIGDKDLVKKMTDEGDRINVCLTNTNDKYLNTKFYSRSVSFEAKSERDITNKLEILKDIRTYTDYLNTPLIKK